MTKKKKKLPSTEVHANHNLVLDRNGEARNARHGNCMRELGKDRTKVPSASIECLEQQRATSLPWLPLGPLGASIAWTWQRSRTVGTGLTASRTNGAYVAIPASPRNPSAPPPPPTLQRRCKCRTCLQWTRGLQCWSVDPHRSFRQAFFEGFGLCCAVGFAGRLPCVNRCNLICLRPHRCKHMHTPCARSFPATVGLACPHQLD